MSTISYWPGNYLCGHIEPMMDAFIKPSSKISNNYQKRNRWTQLHVKLDEQTSTWQFKFNKTYKKRCITFKLNEVVNFKTYDKQQCSMVVVKDETTNGIIMTQTPSEGPEVVVKVQKEFHNGLTFELSSHGKKAIVKFLASPDVQAYHFSPMEEELHTPDEMDTLEEKMRQFVIE